jgi:hypothetical protein
MEWNMKSNAYDGEAQFGQGTMKDLLQQPTGKAHHLEDFCVGGLEDV